MNKPTIESKSAPRATTKLPNLRIALMTGRVGSSRRRGRNVSNRHFAKLLCALARRSA